MLDILFLNAPASGHLPAPPCQKTAKDEGHHTAIFGTIQIGLVGLRACICHSHQATIAPIYMGAAISFAVFIRRFGLHDHTIKQADTPPRGVAQKGARHRAYVAV